jgi:hypothetical protein
MAVTGLFHEASMPGWHLLVLLLLLGTTQVQLTLKQHASK